MISVITLLLLLRLGNASETEAPRFVVRVVDAFDFSVLPGMTVALFRAGAQSTDKPVLTATTNSEGEASLPVALDQRYDIVAFSPNFIPARVGPFTVTEYRLKRPALVVVLNLAFPSPVILPTHPPGTGLADGKK